MGHRLSKISTRTGDDGTTGLGDGTRVEKDDLRIQTLGDIDELIASLGYYVHKLSTAIFRQMKNSAGIKA